MEYLIKHDHTIRGKKDAIYSSNDGFLLKVSKKLPSIEGKEIIYDNSDKIIYLVDTFEKKGNYQSTIYDASSNEVLTAYLSNTFSGFDLYVSSPSKTYTVSHRMDMSVIHLYKNGEIVATIQQRKSFFNNNYILNMKPQQNEELIHLFAIVITKLLDYKN